MSLDLPEAWSGSTKSELNYTFPSQWSGGGSWVGADWSDDGYEYVWMQYSNYSGTNLKLKIEYGQYTNPYYLSEEVTIVETSGFIRIPINKTSVITDDNNADPTTIGDKYAKHVRQVVVQNAGTSSASITIQGIWVGTQAEYLTDIGYDNTKNHVLQLINSETKAQIYDNSATYTFANALTEGTKYTVTAKICAADVTSGAIMKFALTGGTAKYGNELAVLANTFTQVSQEFTAGANTGLEIQLGFINGRVYIDDVSVVAEGTSTNLVSNGDFEVALSTEGWSVPGWTGQSISHTEKALGDVALGAQKVVIGETGYTTMCASNPLQVPASLKAYYAKYDNTNGNVKLTAVTTMSQWRRAVVNGTPGTYYFPQILASDTDDDQSKDGMDVSWGSTKGNGSSIYALGKKNSVVGFYLVANGQTIPAGKAYMTISAGARDFIGFGDDDDTTGIDAVKQETKADNQYFNLAGQRVAHPTKGLYIVNGKKVIIK